MKGFGLIFSFAVAAGAAASNVVNLTPQNFDDIVLRSGKPTMVKFFAPWCGPCKRLAPVWEQLADSSNEDVTIAQLNVQEHKPLAERYGVKRYPTIKYFDGKSDTPIQYDSRRDLKSLQKFIATQSDSS